MPNDLSPVLTVMQGDGFYNRNSRAQAAGIDAVVPLWEKALRSIEIGREPIVVADYACSQGRNSLAPISVAIAHLRSRTEPDRPVEVIHIDLPTNDFSSLFDVLETAPESYLRRGPGVTASAVGRSYFKPILPEARVHAGWNSWSLHWLSRLPAYAPDHVSACFSADKDVLAAVALQQAEDWRRFLEARAVEMRAGGKLLTLSSGKPERGRGWAWIEDALWQTASELRDRGVLSAGELLRMTFPWVERSVADIEGPFGASRRFAGLELEHAEVIRAPDPFWHEYLETGDSALLGKRWSDTVRAYYAPLIRPALEPGREQESVLDCLFARFAERLADNPQVNEHYGVVAVLRKC
jgi:hypothetical protein